MFTNKHLVRGRGEPRRIWRPGRLSEAPWRLPEGGAPREGGASADGCQILTPTFPVRVTNLQPASNLPPAWWVPTTVGPNNEVFTVCKHLARMGMRVKRLLETNTSNSLASDSY